MMVQFLPTAAASMLNSMVAVPLPSTDLTVAVASLPFALMIFIVSVAAHSALM